jgi:hypothetical protein
LKNRKVVVAPRCDRKNSQLSRLHEIIGAYPIEEVGISDNERSISRSAPMSGMLLLSTEGAYERGRSLLALKTAFQSSIFFVQAAKTGRPTRLKKRLRAYAKHTDLVHKLPATSSTV